MPQMAYSASAFPPSYGPALSGTKTLPSHGKSSSGRRSRSVGAELMHISRHGPYSAFEIVYRAAILFANLREMPSGDLARSAAYEGLDPSEKGAVSYFMGLTVAKLTAGRLLDVPWLMHLDVYRNELGLPAGSTRPDLLGRNASGAWVAMEAKGRTHGLSEVTMTKAKKQVEALRSVGGEPITLGVALQAHFGGGMLRCEMRDPEVPDEARLDLKLEGGRFVEDYYRPFREWLPSAARARTEAVQGQLFFVAELPEVDLSVGLREDLLMGRDDTLARRAGADETAPAADEGFAGADGILVRTGALWSAENMRLEPQARQGSSARSAGDAKG